MKIFRRAFLKSAGTLALAASGCVHVSPGSKRILVNDVQSRLNATLRRSSYRSSLAIELRATISHAAETGKSVSICGGRHAMGGQQFLTDGILVDTSRLSRVLSFDSEQGQDRSGSRNTVASAAEGSSRDAA